MSGFIFVALGRCLKHGRIVAQLAPKGRGKDLMIVRFKWAFRQKERWELRVSLVFYKKDVLDIVWKQVLNAGNEEVIFVAGNLKVNLEAGLDSILQTATDFNLLRETQFWRKCALGDRRALQETQEHGSVESCWPSVDIIGQRKKPPEAWRVGDEKSSCGTAYMKRGDLTGGHVKCTYS